MTHDLPSIISDELNIPRKSVNATIKLLDDGATIPFISRYRKEATGSLDEVAIHNIKLRTEALRELIKRKEYILGVIGESGNLTDELTARIEATLDSSVLEDIYLPYKPKRRTRASIARERGLEPLAKMIMAQNATGIIDTARRVRHRRSRIARRRNRRSRRHHSRMDQRERERPLDRCAPNSCARP